MDYPEDTVKIITDPVQAKVLRRIFPSRADQFDIIAWKEHIRDMLHVRLVNEDRSTSITGLSRVKQVRDQLTQLIKLYEETTPND